MIGAAKVIGIFGLRRLGYDSCKMPVWEADTWEPNSIFSSEYSDPSYDPFVIVRITRPSCVERHHAPTGKTYNRYIAINDDDILSADLGYSISKHVLPYIYGHRIALPYEDEQFVRETVAEWVRAAVDSC